MAAGNSFSRPEPGQPPKIVPIVIVIRPQMLCAEASGKKPGMGNRLIPVTALVFNPLDALVNRPEPPVIRIFAGQPEISLHNPEHLTVGIPLALLGLKVTGHFLKIRKSVQDSVGPL